MNCVPGDAAQRGRRGGRSNGIHPSCPFRQERDGGTLDHVHFIMPIVAAVSPCVRDDANHDWDRPNRFTIVTMPIMTDRDDANHDRS